MKKKTTLKKTKDFVFNSKGMTLLEVIIALVLFTFISISLMRMTNTSIQYKKKITRNVKDTKLIRNVLQIIRKDIVNTFYIKDMNSLAHTLIIKQNKTSPSSNNEKAPQDRTTIEFNAFEKIEIEPYLSLEPHFLGGMTGKSNSLYIVSLSNIRNQENAKISDQNIIIYYLKPCKNRKNKTENSSCLWRKASLVINQDPENLEHYNESVLLEKVKKFQLSYYNMHSNEWLKEWETHPTKSNTLPSNIRIEIEFKNKKNQSVKQEMNIPLYQQFILPVGKNT